jgi:tetratricopeptide (TPR) repeat protein
LRLWMRIALIAVAIGGLVSQVPGLVSTERIRASDAKLADGDPARARELANEAIDAEPWAGSAYAARALANEAAGDLNAARSDAEDAVDREPYDWRTHLLLARIDAGSGNRAGVEAQLREARRLAPRSPFLYPISEYRKRLDALLERNSVSSKG